MANKTLYKARWLWQDYTGAKWQNLSWANTGDDHASYVYPQGKNSKSAYRPKSLFYHYQVTGIDANKYKIDSVQFVIITGKFNNRSNPFPTIKVYHGDNNSPYKTKPITTVSSPKFLKNKYDFDSYTMQFTIRNLTVAQLKNLIIEVDWGKTKINGASTISVNRARLHVNYSLQHPKWTLYESITPSICETSKTAAWKLTVKNSGYCGSGDVELKLPKGVTVHSSSGQGKYDSSTKIWRFNGCKGTSLTRTFYIKSSTVGVKELTALNNPLYATNVNVHTQVSFIPPAPPIVPFTPDRDDVITYTFYETFEKEEGQYFDVNIQGMKENHEDDETVCYRINTSNNIILTTPLKNNAELLEGNINISNINSSVSTPDNTICFDLDNPNQDFVANFRVYMYCTDDTEGTVSINANGKENEESFDILPARKFVLVADAAISRDKQFVQNSINIGVPNVWTIKTKNSRHNFFDEKKPDFSIPIEKLIAYIGCIPLSRAHKADVTSDVTNTLIDNRYLNRRYLGKEGNYLEKIGMTLRMKWQDVATLKGLLEMDKPIPIDTCPELPDGDPLNHRGWAELSAVKNIKKINDMLYQCEPEVDYITHKLITKFAIMPKDKLTNNSIDYFLSQTHNYNDDILSRFNLTYYQFWTNIEDENGNIVGSYSLEPATNLLLNGKEKLSDYCNYNIKFRNTLPVLMSEDYDNNWEMAFRIIDKESRKTLFEHLYNNFKHYDFNNGQVLNVCDATSRVFDGNNYNILNFEKISLGYGDLASLLEDNKISTHFNSLDDTIFNTENTQFELFLLDNANKGIANEKVYVKIEGVDEYVNRFDIITDIFGRIIFPINLANGVYTVSLDYDESEKYRACSYNVDITVDYREIELEFEYPSSPTALTPNSMYSVKVSYEDNPMENIMLHYSFRDASSNKYGYERTATTGADGVAYIPIDWTNGSKMLKVEMKGFVDNGNLYQPVMFEHEVNINILLQNVNIQADNVVLQQGERNKEYYAIITNDSGSPIEGTANIAFYNNNECFVKEVTINENGVVSAPILLSGDAWSVDVHFKGNDNYKPAISSKTITIDKWRQLTSSISAENLEINEDDVIAGVQDYYTITLVDGDNKPIQNEPVSIIVESIEDGSSKINVILKTDDKGIIKVPYLGHGENVRIISDYKGCARYKPTSHSDIVTFEEVKPKNNVDFSYNSSRTELQIKHGNGAFEDIWTAEDSVDRVIVNYPNDNRTVHEGMFYYYSMNSNTYVMTLFYEGNDEYYSHAETFTFEKSNDSRGGRWDWIESQGIEGIPSENFSMENSESGGLNKISLDVGYELPYAPIYLGVNCNYGSILDYDELINNSEYQLITMPQYHEENGVTHTLIEFDVINPTTFMEYPEGVYPEENMTHFTIMQDINDFVCHTQLDVPPIIPAFVWNFYEKLTPKTKVTPTLTQNGLGKYNQTYQDVDILVSSTEAANHTRVNDYVIIKLYNPETFEEIFIYTYLVDNVTKSNTQFLLSKGTWNVEIVSKDTNDYYGVSYRNTISILDDVIYNIKTDFFYNNGNYAHNSIYVYAYDNSISLMDLPPGDYALTYDFTNANIFKLSFDSLIGSYQHTPGLLGASSSSSSEAETLYYSDSGFIIGMNPNIFENEQGEDYDYEEHMMEYISLHEYDVFPDWCIEDIPEGIIVNNSMLREIKNGQVIETIYLGDDSSMNHGNFTVERKGDEWRIFLRGNLIYDTQNKLYNTFGLFGTHEEIKNIQLAAEEVYEITPIVQDYDGTVFGSNLYLALRKNILDMIDYGMLPEGENGAGKIILNDVQLIEADYEMEMEIRYNNSRFERLNPLEGLMQMQILEDISMSSSALKYNELLCSPVPLNNAITQFTRLTDEGTMYYVTPLNGAAKYLCNPYIQYKGGVDLKTETGISVFNLDNGYSPISLSNGLVKAEFHRRSGYVVLSRFDEQTESWYSCQTFHLINEPDLELLEDYSDDRAKVKFGDTYWTMWRGRPFIKVEHADDDFRILNLVDRVYCETMDNEFNMGFIEEHDTTYSIFNPRMSIQQFKQELHIGQNIKLDNFELFTVDDNLNETEEEIAATLGIQEVSNDNAIKMNLNNNARISLVFPSNSSYVKKPAPTFSLLVGHFVQNGITDLKVKARGYNEKGKVKSVEELQYGIWEETKEITLADDGELNEIRVTFKDIPNNVKYIDFSLILTGTGGEALLKDIMLYEGDSEDNKIGHDVDTSLVNASKVELTFNETYYACLYDDDSPCGLAVFRPNKQPFTLRTLTKSNETVLIPYMKTYAEYDSVDKLILEYLNSNEQIINVEWRG